MASNLLRVLGQSRRSTFCMCMFALGLTGLIAKNSLGQQGELFSDSTFGTTLKGAFPKDWYVRDGEGLESLRNLEGKPATELAIAEWKGEARPLAQLKGRLLAEISDLEKSYFATDTKVDPQTAKDTLHRWHTRLGGVNPEGVPMTRTTRLDRIC
ncbi:MAG: hypothetical protein WCK15_07985 [Pirellula sp.]